MSGVGSEHVDDNDLLQGATSGAMKRIQQIEKLQEDRQEARGNSVMVQMHNVTRQRSTSISCRHIWKTQITKQNHWKSKTLGTIRSTSVDITKLAKKQCTDMEKERAAVEEEKAEDPEEEIQQALCTRDIALWPADAEEEKEATVQ